MGQVPCSHQHPRSQLRGARKGHRPSLRCSRPPGRVAGRRGAKRRDPTPPKEAPMTNRFPHFLSYPARPYTRLSHFPARPQTCPWTSRMPGSGQVPDAPSRLACSCRHSDGGGRARAERGPAHLGHTVWAHDPNSRRPDFSPPEPAASPSANWTVPIFWPLSAQWAPVQLPAWLPAQDGHGRQQAPAKRGADKWRGNFPLGCTDATSQPSPSPDIGESPCCSSTLSPSPNYTGLCPSPPPGAPMRQGLCPPLLRVHLRGREPAGALSGFSDLSPPQPCRSGPVQPHFRDQSGGLER